MKSTSIHLIPCNRSIFEAILESDERLSSLLQINVPNQWSEFGKGAFEYGLTKVLENPSSASWWTYLPILSISDTLIGSCGYKGPPDANGSVEIGYEVAKTYRNKGYATQIANQLIENAFQYEQVLSIIAHTLGEENASTAVLKKCGFEFIEEIIDPEDGLIWKWKLKK